MSQRISARTSPPRESKPITTVLPVAPVPLPIRLARFFACMFFAFPAAILSEEFYVRAFAGRAANNAVRPTRISKKCVGNVQIGKVVDGVEKRFRIARFRLHAGIVRQCGHLVKYIVTLRERVAS